MFGAGAAEIPCPAPSCIDLDDHLQKGTTALKTGAITRNSPHSLQVTPSGCHAKASRQSLSLAWIVPSVFPGRPLHASTNTPF